MATSGNNDENETETTIDVSGFIRAFVGDGDDEHSDENAYRTGDISMFCKACLHPYCGEQKSGTIVLRCERCGQTDTVLEESVGSLNPQEWIGNLMMNRFITVVKEQEDLSANLSDPNFAEDDYKRITLWLSEYTFNMEKIALHLFDMAKKAKLASEEDKDRIESCQKEDASAAGLAEVQAMNATKTLLEIHKTLIMNDPKQHVDSKALEKETNTLENKTCHSELQIDEGAEKAECTNSDPEDKLQSKIKSQGDQSIESAENVIEIEEKREIIREKLNMIGKSIFALIENLMSKYNIPVDVMISVQDKFRNTQTVETTESSENTEADAETVNNKDEENDENNEISDKEGDASENVDEGDNVKEENCNVEAEESRTIFNVSTETIREEVYNALGHKLKLIFENQQCATRRLDLNQTDGSNFEFQVDENNSDHIEKPVSQTSKDIGDNESKPDEVSEIIDAKEETECIENYDNTSEPGKDPDRLEVNFYSFASEFIRELQRRKSKALGERKSKALANMHEKIERLKKEMERVEEAVTEELALAYKRKMKKVDKQKKQIDEKRSKIKEAERLLEFYAMTGQEDKIAELAAQFDFLHEN